MLISVVFSIVFFLMAILSLIIIGISYQGIQYGTLSGLKVLRVVMLIYGLVIFAVSLMAIIVENISSDASFVALWVTLSVLT